MDLNAGDRVLIPFHEPTDFNPAPAPVEAELIWFNPNAVTYDDGKGGQTTFGPAWDAKVIAPGTRIHQWLVKVDLACIIRK